MVGLGATRSMAGGAGRGGAAGQAAKAGTNTSGPVAGSPARHAGGLSGSDVSSSRSRSAPPSVWRRSRRPGVRPVDHFRHADRADRVRHAPTLRDQHIHLPQLGDDLLRLVPLRSHLIRPLSARRPYLRETTPQGADHSSRPPKHRVNSSAASWRVRRCSPLASSGTEDNPAKLMYGGVLPVLRPGT